MKRIFIALALLLTALPARAQRTASNPLGAQLNVQDAGTCSTTNSFAWQVLPANAATTTVNLSGTFSGTLTIRLSNNGGGSWTTNSTTTTAGTTSVATNGFTDICADVTTFTSGIFQVSISTGLNTGPQGPVGPAGSGGVPGQFSVKTYGAIGDAKRSANVSVTGGNATITSTDNPWVSTDVGKIISCVFLSTPTNGFALGTKIQTFNSAGSVTLSNTAVGGTATYGCSWATQDDTLAFQAAYTAAANAQQYPNTSFQSAGQPSVIYIPPGSYMLNGNWYDCNNASNNTLCPAVIGAGWQSSILYPTSTFTSGARACFMDAVNAASLVWRDFAIFGNDWLFACTGGTPFIRLNAVTQFDIRNIRIDNIGANAGANTFEFFSSQEGLLENMWMQVQSIGSTGACFGMQGSANISIIGLLTSNCGINEIYVNSGVRNASGGQVTVTGGFSDECGNQDCVQLQGSIVNFVGGALFGEPTGAANGALTLDATSTVYLTDMNVGPFSTVLNSNGIGCANGSTVIATGTTIRGGGTTGLLISGPASGTCTFVDDGGNTFSRWNSTTGTTITAALFSGAFSSTVAYKASITHTPNTCYAVTGNLLATAQNLCTLLLDQNYQVVNITAQSGGTTPTNSSCATPPVVTLSDGTRSSTLTMTSGKTAWSSAVDASSVGAVMASAATLTVSIGANTCATPPSNVSVNYVLQSVINP